MNVGEVNQESECRLFMKNKNKIKSNIKSMCIFVGAGIGRRDIRYQIGDIRMKTTRDNVGKSFKKELLEINVNTQTYLWNGGHE